MTKKRIGPEQNKIGLSFDDAVSGLLRVDPKSLPKKPKASRKLAAKKKSVKSRKKK